MPIRLSQPSLTNHECWRNLDNHCVQFSPQANSKTKTSCYVNSLKLCPLCVCTCSCSLQVWRNPFIGSPKSYRSGSGWLTGEISSSRMRTSRWEQSPSKWCRIVANVTHFRSLHPCQDGPTGSQVSNASNSVGYQIILVFTNIYFFQSREPKLRSPKRRKQRHSSVCAPTSLAKDNIFNILLRKVFTFKKYEDKELIT